MRKLKEVMKAKMTSKDVQQKPEARSNLNSSLPRLLGPVCHKMVDTSGLLFSDPYDWKANFIRKTMQLVSHQKAFKINGNY
jgi:hypothetical protein